MIILGVDPGPERSAWVLWDADDQIVLEGGHDTNDYIREYVPSNNAVLVAAIEKVKCYGAPVGQSVLDTVYDSGRLHELWVRSQAGRSVMLITRPDVCAHLCNTPKAKKPQVNQALRDRFGCKGTKANPGPFYGVKSHMWDAVAVAVVAGDVLKALGIEERP